MSKITLLYVGMIVAFVGGLWSIIRVGQSLRAPHDLSGSWTVVRGDRADERETFTVNQSGLFVKLRTEGQPTLHLTQEGPASGERDIRFKGENQELTVSLPEPKAAGPDSTAEYRFRLTGSINGDYRATRATTPAGEKPAK